MRVFEKRVMVVTGVVRRAEATGGYRALRIQQVSNFYPLLCTRVIK